MALHKRGSVWWIDFVAPNGARIRRTTETRIKREAEKLHDELKTELWRVQMLGDRPRRIWEDAAARWLDEQSHKASLESDKGILRWLDRHLAGVELTNIDRKCIARITKAKKRGGRTNATVNRMLALLRAILRRCANDWECLDRAPAIRMRNEPTRRIRFLTREQAAVLLQELPGHLRAMATFTLATGLRRANVTGLTWEQVDLERKLAWLHPGQAKSRKGIAVPLNETAIAVLQDQIGQHPKRVFTYCARPIFQVSTKAWYDALARAGIENFRWHDLRHTWASWHAQNGTPLVALQEMGGWKTEKMVHRYAHLAVEHLAVYANALDLFPAGP